MSPDLALALELGDAADAISLPRFRSGLAVETKPDLTPVTEADRAVEAELRRRLATERPDDAILGEEEGTSGGGPRRWILDPIDGTRNYARGVPVWATLIALEDDGVLRLGVVSAPALGRRWWAERGQGAFADGGRVTVSSVMRRRGGRAELRLRERRAGSRAARLARARARGLLGAHARGRGRRRRSGRRPRRERMGSRRGSGDRRGGRRAVLRLLGRRSHRRQRSDHVERPPTRRAAFLGRPALSCAGSESARADSDRATT